ncbi:hypothetical protein J6590_019687 [Homalodisca vitripennis]|nr:hypothetical protein J6590_019687 [Homalodisca vitripennis]
MSPYESYWQKEAYNTVLAIIQLCVVDEEYSMRNLSLEHKQVLMVKLCPSLLQVLSHSPSIT